MERAKIEDIKRLAKKIKDSFSLCNFMGKTEREVLVAQTIHAAVINHKAHGKPFSFNKIRYSSRMCDNFSAYDWLIERKYFMEDKRQGQKVIFPTQALIDKLNVFFSHTENQNGKEGCSACNGSGLKTDSATGVQEDDVCPECDGEEN